MAEAADDVLVNDDVIERALQPQEAGALVKTLSTVLPGVARTRDQIANYRNLWIESARIALADDKPVLAILGDSLGQGIGAVDINNSYAFRIEAKLRARGSEPFNVLNLSKSGARVDDVLNEQLPALMASGVKLTAGLCTVGSNDLTRSSRVGATKRRLTQLIEELPDGFIIATLPAAGSTTAKHVNKHVRAEAERVGRPVADVAAFFTSRRGKLAGDGFHPNDNGYEAWADAFLEQL